MGALGSIGESFESIFRKDIIGGVIPGCVLLLEIYLIVAAGAGRDGFRELQGGWATLSTANLTSSIVFAVVFASMGWMTGWLVRKIGFTIIGIKRIRRAAIGKSGLPGNTGDVLRSLLITDQLGYDDAARSFPWWPKDPSSIEDDTVLFHKAKQWLVHHDQENAVTDKEATINALAATIPVFLLGTVIFLWVSPLAAVAMLVVCVILVVFAVRERRNEEFDIFRNIINSNSYLNQEQVSSTRVPWNLFESIFRDSSLIRTKFDWEAARSLEVRLEVLSAIPSNWYTAWYSRVDAHGTIPADFDTVGAVPIAIAEAAELGEELSEERILAIMSMASVLAKQALVVFSAVAWRTPSGHTVILDGNHRAVASHVFGLNIRASVFVIYGPAEGRIVPDLAHHE